MLQNNLDIFRKNGRKIGKIRDQIAEFAQANWNMSDIDSHASELISKAGGEPAFKRVPGYDWATCISVNDAIVHGIPKGKLKKGDIVTLDTGMYFKGTTTDTATTIVIGKPTSDQEKFLKTGRKALKKAISNALIGSQIKILSQSMQQVVEKAGYTVSRTLTGHGLGETMHEEPPIPCFISSDPVLKTKLKIGMVLAVEIMYMKGTWQLKTAPDGWTLSTQDGLDSAVFEEDVIITEKGPEVITNTSLLEPEVKV